MPNRKTIASVLIFAGSALCFFLPFVTVSCSGMKVATFTGQQLATGIHSTQAQPFGSVRTENYNGNPFAGLAFLCAIAGVGLSLAGRRLAAGAAASGGVGAIALFVMKSRLDEQLKTQSMGLAQVSYEPGFMLATSLLIAGFAWNLYLFFRSRQAAPANDSLQPEMDRFRRETNRPQLLPDWNPIPVLLYCRLAQAKRGRTRLRLRQRPGTALSVDFQFRRGSDFAGSAARKWLNNRPQQNAQARLRRKLHHLCLPPQ